LVFCGDPYDSLFVSSVTFDNFAVIFAINCESKVVFDPKNGSNDDFCGCSVFADSTSE
jgi:hypothetical protein